MKDKLEEALFYKFCTLINKEYGEYIIRDKNKFIKEIHDYAEAYHSAKMQEVTDEDIQIYVDFYHPEYTTEEANAYRRGAEAMRDCNIKQTH